MLQNSDGSLTFVLALLARDPPRLIKAADTRAGFPASVLHAFAEVAVRYVAAAAAGASAADGEGF